VAWDVRALRRRLPKGRRLLRRSIGLLLPEFARPLFGTIFRNLGALQVMTPSSPRIVC
jgi:hypothetical protein